MIIIIIIIPTCMGAGERGGGGHISPDLPRCVRPEGHLS